MATTIRAPRPGSAATTAVPIPRPADRPPPRPPLRVVRPAPRRARIGIITAVATLIIFSVLLGLVLFQTMMVQNQARLDRLDAQVRDQQATYQQLRLQVAQLESPSRIVAVASEKLGMVPPPGTTYLTPSATDAAANGVTAPILPGSGGTSARDWQAIKPYLGTR